MLPKFSIDLNEQPLTSSELICVLNKLRENTALTHLKIKRHRLSDTEIQSLADILETHKNFTHLVLSCDKLQLENIKILAAALKNQSTLKCLTFAPIGEIEHWAEVFKSMTTLSTLNLFMNLREEGTVRTLALALKAHPSLRTLNLPHTFLQDESIEHLATILIDNKTLTNLDLTGSTIDIKGATALAHLLEQNTVKHLNLSQAKITSEGLQILANALEKNSHLEVLDLSESLNSALQLLIVTSALKKNQFLKQIYLTPDPLERETVQRLTSTESIEAITSVLINHPNLTTVHFNCGDISNETLKALALAIEQNNKLKDLKINLWNPTPEEGTKALLTALKNHPTLSHLEFGGIPRRYYVDLSEDTFSELTGLIEKNKQLQSLKLPACSIENQFAEKLAVALSKNDTLTHLDLENNDLRSEGGKQIALALQSNQTLRSLNLKCCLIRDEGAQAIASALSLNTSLTTLLLYGNEIGNIGKNAILSAAATNTALTQVKFGHLDNNYCLTKEERKALSTRLINNKTLKHQKDIVLIYTDTYPILVDSSLPVSELKQNLEINLSTCSQKNLSSSFLSRLKNTIQALWNRFCFFIHNQISKLKKVFCLKKAPTHCAQKNPNLIKPAQVISEVFPEKAISGKSSITNLTHSNSKTSNLKLTG